MVSDLAEDFQKGFSSDFSINFQSPKAGQQVEAEDLIEKSLYYNQSFIEGWRHGQILDQICVYV